MAANEIHVGDVGTVFEITLKDGTQVVDLSSATEITLTFKKADNASVTKTKTGAEVTFKTDGTDGIIQYTGEAGLLTVGGAWSLQVQIVLPTGTFNSDVGDFDVHVNL